jgi:hypothetical protein
MNQDRLFGVVMGAVLACCVPATSQELGPWRAANSPAQTITGDVAFSDSRLSIDFSSFPIARIRDLEPGEVSAVFDVDSSAGGRGSLYRLSIPAAKKFMHHNTICGSEDTQWVAAFVPGATCTLRSSPDKKCPCLLPKRSRTQRIYAAHLPMADEPALAMIVLLLKTSVDMHMREIPMAP